MSNNGIMDQIREHLVQGKSSRDLIDMGYRPGSVYGTMRKIKLEEGNTRRRPKSRDNTVQQLTGRESAIGEDGEIEWPIRHIEPALTCPGCNQKVAHWAVCPCCGRLMPLECTCAVEGSPHFGEVYSLDELRPSAGGCPVQIHGVQARHRQVG